MRKRIRTSLALGACAGLILVLMGARSEPELRKGTTYLLIQGGGLEAPVVIHRGPTPGADRGSWTYGGDPLMDVLGTLMTIDQKAPTHAEGRFYEVGEFTGYDPPPGPDGAPSQPLRMEDATAISRIYPDEPGGPIWNYRGFVLNDMVLHLTYGPEGLDHVEAHAPEVPIESPALYKRIVPRGVEMLEAHGLVFGRVR